MHTYRKRGEGWEVGFQHSNSFDALGPRFGVECEAAAFASFLNGGRYNPYEIEALFRIEPAIDDTDEIAYPRPQGMDYEPEAARK
jgi:hypothetical protein